MEDLQEEYRPGCGPHKRDEKKDFEAVAKLLMKEKTFTSAFIQKSLAMSYFNVQQILGKMEKLGMVSPEKADKTREVLIAPGQFMPISAKLIRNTSSRFFRPLDSSASLPGTS